MLWVRVRGVSKLCCPARSIILCKFRKLFSVIPASPRGCWISAVLLRKTGWLVEQWWRLSSHESSGTVQLNFVITLLGWFSEKSISLRTKCLQENCKLMFLRKSFKEFGRQIPKSVHDRRCCRFSSSRAAQFSWEINAMVGVHQRMDILEVTIYGYNGSWKRS